MIQGLTPPAAPSGCDKTKAPICIDQLFEVQAERTPDAIAVSCGAEKMTYAELDRKANQLANYLRSKRVGTEVPVALYLDRSVQMVVAILGVLKAGGTYVPIDLAYPRERISFMLEDTCAPVLLTEARLFEAVRLKASNVLCLDSSAKVLASESSEAPARLGSAENAAYIIYTSGSTGKPKGVVVTHRNVVRLLRSTDHWYGFNGCDVWPLFHSYAFDVSVWELWGCLFHGGRLVVVPHLVTRTPSEFYRLLAEEGVTVLNQTPSAFRQLIWAEQNAAERLPLKLRYVICAGEALELQSLKPWFELHGDEQPQVVNMYGITETTVHSTYRVIRKADLASGAGSIIGVPIPDLQIYLVDDNLKQVAAGTPGEICVGGAGVARGYLNRPQLTRQRFVPDPFSDCPGAVMYRSGDLAQVNSFGEMEYLGRMDHQVKIRGFRVELGEIESSLNRHPAIRESVVIAQDSLAGDKRLVAYVVPRNGTQPTVSELREHLAPMIPDYMLPAAFVQLNSLPLTTNGKVDRRALPAPGFSRPALRNPFVPARTPSEEQLCRIWSEVLGVQGVGVNDNFFEVGGDSIQAIRVLAKAEAMGCRLSLEQIFTNPTVARLAECITAGHSREPFQELEPFALITAEDRALLPEDVENAYPVGRLQLGMFYYNELEPASAMYHDVFSYRVSSRLEATQLEKVLENLVRRHPLLRTSFHLAGYSEPLQFVHKEARVILSWEDLSALEEAEQDLALIAWVEEEKQRPFDRSTAPLCRFHAQLRAGNEFQFIISFHHSCLDGWSLAAAVTEIFREYALVLSGKADSLRQPRPGYGDFVALEQQAIRSTSCHSFWKQLLENPTRSTLPRWPVEQREGGYEQKRGPEIFVAREVLQRLRQLAQEEGVPLKTVLLAAHMRVMATVYGQTDVLTGLVVNGRPEASEGERILGLFLNTVPFRQELAGGSWRELVQATFAAEQKLMAHRRMPLAEIQKMCGGQPLFETAFDFVHFHVLKELQKEPGIEVAEGHYFEANNLTTYTTMMLDVDASRLEVHIDYDPRAIARTQAEQLTAYYVNVLSAMAEQPDAAHARFSPLSAAEQEQVLRSWNSTAVDYQRERTIEELVGLQAASRPQKTAVICGTERLTYAELDQRATQLARSLQLRGAGPGTLIGICLNRSVEMLVGLLGILKSGAAYVPLDPMYPEARLAFMLQDSRAAIVLTERELLDLWSDAPAKICLVEEESSRGAAEGNGSREPARAEEGRAEGLAYVIYTSGSTGRPKGVQVTHKSVINLVLSAAATANFTPHDTLLAVTTLSFDIAGLELWMPLVTGGTVVVAPNMVTGDGTRLAQLIADSKATFMQGTPATWRLLIESGWRGTPDLTVFCGGEALKPSLAKELLVRAKTVWNFYGPTETTIWSTAAKIETGEPITIGRPLANTQLYVLDGNLQPVPVGVVGELHIAGDGVAVGYLNRLELTAEKFVPNPFGAEGSRLYKTGDLVRNLPDGRVECLGRLDNQVKVRGFRIELGEIESVLRQYPGVAEALVVPADDGVGEKRLVGYVKSRNGPLSAQDLRDFVKSKLPLYMVPSAYINLQQFPLTPNGKVDVNALPRPETRMLEAKSYVPPKTADEQGLVEIWQEVLLVKCIGIDDNFFELGGDSLSATRAFARANKAFGMALTLREMLERPTIRGLAQLVSQAKGSAPSSAAAIPRQPRTWAANRAR